MERKGRERVLECFGPKRAVITTASLCLFYIIFHFFPESKYIIKLLPPMPLWCYFILGSFVLVSQVLIWKKFGLFFKRWYQDLIVDILFLSEWIMAFFIVGLMSWPIYFVAYVIFLVSRVP